VPQLAASSLKAALDLGWDDPAAAGQALARMLGLLEQVEAFATSQHRDEAAAMVAVARQVRDQDADFSGLDRRSRSRGEQASAPGHDRSDSGDAQEIELRGSLGSRGRRVGDDAQAGAADAEHVAIELDVTDDIVPHDLPLRLVLAHGAALPQLPEPVARRQQFLDQGPHPAIAGVSAVNPAEVGHERRLEGAGIARPADDPSLAVAQGRPGEV
jgi:hypothetical protein